MDKGHDGPLLEVAKAISDGAPVDWDRQSAAHEKLKPEMGRMRLLEAVAAAHRAQALEEGNARPLCPPSPRPPRSLLRPSHTGALSSSARC